MGTPGLLYFCSLRPNQNDYFVLNSQSAIRIKDPVIPSDLATCPYLIKQVYLTQCVCTGYVGGMVVLAHKHLPYCIARFFSKGKCFVDCHHRGLPIEDLLHVYNAQNNNAMHFD